MELSEYVSSTGPFSSFAAQSDVDVSIDEFLGTRRTILGKKLEVFVAEIAARLALRSQKIDKVCSEREKVEGLIEFIHKKIPYNPALTQQGTMLHQQVFRLEEELRREETDCWRDLVMIMRDLLFAWEGYESARARGRFLNAGRAGERPLQ